MKQSMQKELLKLLKINFVTKGFVVWLVLLMNLSVNATPKDSLDVYLKRTFTSVKKEDIAKFYRRYLNELVSVEQIKGAALKKVKYYSNRGNFFKNNTLYKESNKNYRKLLSVVDSVKAEKRTDTLSAIILFTHNSLANNLLQLNQKEEALEVYKKGLAFLNSKQVIFSPVYFNKNVMSASQLNNIGVFYSDHLQEYAIALDYFQKAFTLVKENKFSNIIGSIRDNMALAYLRTNKLSKAQKLFKQNINFYRTRIAIDKRSYEPWLRSIVQENETNLQLGKLKDASLGCANIKQILDTLAIKNKAPLQLRYYKLLEKVNIAKGNYAKAFEVRNRVIRIKDSCAKIQSTERTGLSSMYKKIAIDYRKGYIKKEQEKNKTVREQELFYYYLSMISAILLMIVIVVGINLFRRKWEIMAKNQSMLTQKLEIQSMERELLNNKKEVLKKDLFNFELNNYQYQKWVKDYLALLQTVKGTVGRARVKHLKTLEEELEHKLQLETKTQLHYQKIKDLDPEFFGKLYHYNPPLNKAEIKLCTMIRLGYNNLKIASLQYINLKTVHQNRYKLRLKLHLTSDDDLNEFVKNI